MASSFPAVFYAFRTYPFPSLRRRSEAPPSSWRRGAASNRWNGAAAADAPLFFSSSLSSLPSPAVPFCPLSPDGVLRRHWRSSRLLPPGANPEPPEDDAKRGEHGGIYAIDPVAPVGGQAGPRVCATASSSSVALPLQKVAIRAESIGRPPGRTTERERRYLPPFSLPLNTVMANFEKEFPTAQFTIFTSICLISKPACIP